MSLSGILQAGLSGVMTTTIALQTASNNIANESTPGYVSETPILAENAALSQSFGSLGEGVSTLSVARNFSSFAQTQVLSSSSVASGLNSQQTLLSSLTSIFPVSSGQSGLSSAIDSFFSAAQTLTSNPSSIPYRQSVLSDGNSLAAQFQNAANTIGSTQSATNQQIIQSVQGINGITQQLADINQSLLQTPAGAQPSNSLLDSQNNLLQQLSAQMGIQVLPGQDGGVSVFTKGGLSLVDGTSAFGFTVNSGGVYQNQQAQVVYGLAPMQNGMVSSGGDTLTLSGSLGTQNLMGGALGGAVTAQTQISQVGLQLSLLAQGLATVVNQQQAMGVDLNGNAGAAIFAISGPTIYPASTNSGTADIKATITNLATVPPTEYELQYNGSSWVAVDLTNQQSVPLLSGSTSPVTTLSAGTYSLSGVGISLSVSSGLAATGDTFLLDPSTMANSLQVNTSVTASNIAAAAPYVVTPGAMTTASGLVDSNLGMETLSSGAVFTGASTVAAVVPSGDFGQALTVQFTSSGSYNVVSGYGTMSSGIVASGAYSAGAGAVAIDLPLPTTSGGTQVTSGYVQFGWGSQGTPVSGDAFTLTIGGAGNNANAVLMSNAMNNPALYNSGGTSASLNQAVANMTGSYGDTLQSVQQGLTAAQTVQNQANNAMSSISGVNLNEEATMIVQYTQAYQASASVIQAANTLFQSLLTAVGGA